MICESCHGFMHPLSAVHVKFDDEDQFYVCAECAQAAEGRILETLNRIRYWRTGTLAAT